MLHLNVHFKSTKELKATAQSYAGSMLKHEQRTKSIQWNIFLKEKKSNYALTEYADIDVDKPFDSLN